MVSRLEVGAPSEVKSSRAWTLVSRPSTSSDSIVKEQCASGGADEAIFVTHAGLSNEVEANRRNGWNEGNAWNTAGEFFGQMIKLPDFQRGEEKLVFTVF